MRLVFALLAALAGALISTSATAEEVIRSYHADITVNPDASMRVVETVRVKAEGRDIRRGIFRDFPLYALDQDGRTIEVDFDLVAVTRDGRPEPHHTESISGGIRIYAGDADVYLDRGEYTYTFTYDTDRWITFYDDQDELYWNVNGTGWIFPVDKVSATVHLPGDARPTETDFDTGGYGAEGKDARVEVSGSEVYFETTKRLDREEGLTILVGIPKGVLSGPSGAKVWWWYLRDNANTIIGLGGLLVVTLYYLKAWIAVGRDPEKGVVVPRWDAPDGLSPALVNYVENKGFSAGGWTAFSASAIDLAVKGLVELDDLEKSIVMRRTGKEPAQALPPGQRRLFEEIGRSSGELIIDKANGARVQQVGAKFRDAIEKEHRNRYYQHNAGYIAGGVAISVAVLVALATFGRLGDDVIGFTVFSTILGAVTGAFTVVFGKGVASRSLIVKILSMAVVAVIVFFSLAVIGFMLADMLFDEQDIQQSAAAIAFGGIILINALFFFLMGAPTPLGRKLMDGIEGLRIYLTLAEKDRLNMQGAPKMSPQHFETLLPYAVALGVEKPWTRTFETWLKSAAAGAAAQSYQPAWYHGRSIGGFSSDRIGSFSSSMASTIQSSLPQPKSSSGGGGGSSFSGGGGGGGGGGGW